MGGGLMNAIRTPHQSWAEPDPRAARPAWRGVHLSSGGRVPTQPAVQGHAGAQAIRVTAPPAWPGIRRAAPGRGAGRLERPGERGARGAPWGSRTRWVERGVLAAFASGMLLSGASVARAVQAERLSPAPIERPLVTALVVTNAGAERPSDEP